mmetsp:Transcript_2628/g.5588  ORF Transcript_2628/g.5588 Transcript_2628/m.5588 type:complete len:103 (-) Transcript_2628:192-500(-)
MLVAVLRTTLKVVLTPRLIVVDGVSARMDTLTLVAVDVVLVTSLLVGTVADKGYLPAEDAIKRSSAALHHPAAAKATFGVVFAPVASVEANVPDTLKKRLSS